MHYRQVYTFLNFQPKKTSKQPKKSSSTKEAITLTKKEFHLLEYLMKHPDVIVTRDQILNHLYTFDTERVSNVVAAQMRLLRRKLSKYGWDSFIETVPYMGYRFNRANAD